MNNKIISRLKAMGYKVNADAYNIMKVCESWYRNQTTSFHQRQTIQNRRYELVRMGFAKRACSDEANLLEVINIDVEDGIKDQLESNDFTIMLREQCELTAAYGTVGAYVYQDNVIMDGDSLRGGEPQIAYVAGPNIIPLTVVNHKITECAFYSESMVRSKTIGTLVIFTIQNGVYVMQTKYYTISGGNLVEIPAEQMGVLPEVICGDVPPFAIMQTAEVNNLPNMEGFGLPKIYNVVPLLQALDMAFSLLNSDLSLSDKIVMINEALCGIDDEGKPIKPLDGNNRQFVFLGEKLPEEKTLVHEYNPEIRVTNITDAIEFLLSCLSLMFGFGAKQYNFEQGTIITASQYIGEKQDKMQELNKQRGQTKKYVQAITRALIWSSNAYNGTTYNIDEDIEVEFDDSYIEDKAARRMELRNDAITFRDVPEIVAKYFMEILNIDEEAALKLARSGQALPEGVI